MITGDFMYRAPGILAGIIGAALFVMTIRGRWLVSVLGLLGAVAELFFYLLITSAISLYSKYPDWLESLLNAFCFAASVNAPRIEAR